DYVNCLYYSTITFTTCGYGDVTPPEGVLRPLAAIEAFIGAFMMAMFVAVFGKKMTRG
ncbi:MAG: potassium channel family protein, partial [Gemmatimonadota bacterium]